MQSSKKKCNKNCEVVCNLKGEKYREEIQLIEKDELCTIKELVGIGKKKDGQEEEYENEVPLKEAICFNSINKTGPKLVDLSLCLAKSLLTNTSPSVHKEFNNVHPKRDVNWPTLGQLNMCSGMEAIDKYIQTFNARPELKYCINFLNQESYFLFSSYTFEVKWSVPKKEQPLQMATASMYFILKRYVSYPEESTTDVSYVYEYTQTILKPGQIKFREEYILNLIEHKKKFQMDNGFEVGECIS